MSDYNPADENHVEGPVRGALRLDVRASSPQVTAGSDFSIFVIIQNPFDVPVTIYQVQTHIPVELLDVNRLIVQRLKRKKDQDDLSMPTRIKEFLLSLFLNSKNHSGVAEAIGTNFDLTDLSELYSSSLNISSSENFNIQGDIVSSGLYLNFPENPTSEELDRVFQRVVDFQKGLIPVTLQPGNSIVKQFVLKTQRWLLFTPLAHTFQIQVNYSSDGKDHADTVSYEQNIQSTIGAMAIGAVIGASIGSLLQTLTSSVDFSLITLMQPMIVAILASVIVIVAFARKNTAQPIVTVEDFWGGVLIGFSTGYFGFEQFSGLFTS